LTTLSYRPPTAASGNRYKGVGIRSFLAALERLHGASVVAQTLEGADPDCASRVREGRLLATGWYPIEWLRSLHTSAQRVTGTGTELSWRLGGAAMRADFTGVYRIFLLVLSPEALVSKSARVFSTYYTRGKMQVLSSRPKLVHVQFTDCLGFDANLWADVGGSSEAGLELCGAKQVTHETLRGGRTGDDFLEVVARWK
jgi:hypothetical protein